ncbi:hypothetical protein [Vibrio hepatarius]|uniref:hypothetical protein n=1 Tax=Vibrio hepatarius TaxID=171383 RepID=UPI00142E2432|nr:hypothetical protein [Vibrio hepatarius]NIY84609.1 hypothetical protein [Vibrio hepatarius]
MSKRLCKMSRKQIADNLGEIHRLVVEPKFVCRSCARSSASKGALCKPAAIPPQMCQTAPVEQQRACGLLAEALPAPIGPSTDNHSERKAQAVRRVIERVKEKSARNQVNHAIHEVSVMPTAPSLDLSDKKALKKAKKALKKQYKQQKKLFKLAKKQHKLLKRQRKLEAQVSENQALVNVIPSLLEVQSEPQVH